MRSCALLLVLAGALLGAPARAQSGDAQAGRADESPAARPHADAAIDPRDADAAPLLARLAATRDARHRARTLDREQQLTRVLAALPDVAEITVALTLPDEARAPLDAPLPAPRATLVMRTRGAGPSDATLLRLARGTVPDLTAAALTVSRHPSAPPPTSPLVKVGPFDVAAASAPALRALCMVSLACNALLASLLLWRTRRNRPRDPKVDRAGPRRQRP